MKRISCFSGTTPVAPFEGGILKRRVEWGGLFCAVVFRFWKLRIRRKPPRLESPPRDVLFFLKKVGRKSEKSRDRHHF